MSKPAGAGHVMTTTTRKATRLLVVLQRISFLICSRSSGDHFSGFS
jgi:hypothetical protein